MAASKASTSDPRHRENAFVVFILLVLRTGRRRGVAAIDERELDQMPFQRRQTKVG
jgi:hypothetical protein